ncbi:hypothetical protein ABW636_16250 [Aquimarina sp. 2201CG1-2-11]|uniref:hypothetical protein n=1 Tax=Aquimarina discodermiae TaxID=3231043 RepID=UPI003463229A
MKLIFSIITCIVFFSLSYGQKDIKDIKVFNMWSSYNHGKWSEWKPNDEVFILNYIGSNNVARCRLNDKIMVLKMHPDIALQTGKTSDGYSYKLLTVYEWISSIKMELKFFDNNPNYGMELTYGAPIYVSKKITIHKTSIAHYGRGIHN